MNWGPPPADWAPITREQLDELREVLGHDSDNMGDFIVYRAARASRLPFACKPYDDDGILADPEALNLIHENPARGAFGGRGA